MKPKILVIIDQLNPGGAQNFALPLYQKLSADFSIYFLALSRSNPELVRRAESFCQKVIVLDFNFKRPFFIAKRIKKEIKKIRPEIVHTHLTYADIYGRLAAKSSGIKNIFSTVQSLEPWRGNLLSPVGARIAVFDNYLARSCKKIIAVSQEIATVLAEKEGIPHQKIQVIYNGIIPELFKPQKKKIDKIKELNLDSNLTTLGFIGRLEPQKGVSYLLQAIKKLGKQRIFLLIIGNGSLKEQLEKETKELKIDHRVLFLGERNDVAALLEVIDILIMPSLWEGMPLVLLEAMTNKKIIIASDIPGIREAIGPREGILVKPGNALALKIAIKMVLKNPSFYAAMALRAQKRVSKFVNFEKIVKEYKEIYFDALRKKAQKKKYSLARQF